MWENVGIMTFPILPSPILARVLVEQFDQNRLAAMYATAGLDANALCAVLKALGKNPAAKCVRAKSTTVGRS
jgi:hypothetical protein